VKLINKLLVSLLVFFAVIGFASATPMDCQCPSCDCINCDCGCADSESIVSLPIWNGNFSATKNIVIKVGSSKTIPAKKWEKIESINSTFFNEHFNVTRKNDKFICPYVIVTAIKAGHTEFDIKGKHGICHVVLDIVE
jgi:uncharacterized Zn-binding protein involved in type VI secretion